MLRILASISAVAALLAATAPASSSHGTVLLGAAVSESGRDSFDGIRTMNGYNPAIVSINPNERNFST